MGHVKVEFERFLPSSSARAGSHNLVSKGETVNGVGWQFGHHEWRSGYNGRAGDPQLPKEGLVRGIVAQISDEGRGGHNVDLGYATEAIYDGKWHVTQLQRPARTVNLFIDGKLVASKNLDGLGSISNSQDVSIGKHPLQHLKDYHVGNIGEVMISSP